MNKNFNDIMQVMNEINKYQSMFSGEKKDAINLLIESKPELKGFSQILNATKDSTSSDKSGFSPEILSMLLGKDSSNLPNNLFDGNNISLLMSLFNKNKQKENVSEKISETKTNGIEPIINFTSVTILRDIVNLLSK